MKYNKFIKLKDEKCIGCGVDINALQPIDFKVNTHHYHLRKASNINKTNKEKDVYSYNDSNNKLIN